MSSFRRWFLYRAVRLFGECSSPGNAWTYVTVVALCLERGGNRKRALRETGDARRRGEGQTGEHDMGAEETESKQRRRERRDRRSR